jgi:hypothetical protein
MAKKQVKIKYLDAPIVPEGILFPAGIKSLNVFRPFGIFTGTNDEEGFLSDLPPKFLIDGEQNRYVRCCMPFEDDSYVKGDGLIISSKTDAAYEAISDEFVMYSAVKVTGSNKPNGFIYKDFSIDTSTVGLGYAFAYVLLTI